jgi:hypothetical protein
MPGGGSKPGERRGGRKKGTPNKITTDVKDAVLSAFNAAGGKQYLLSVAKADPRTFCTLLGKIIPATVGVGGPDGEGPVEMVMRWLRDDDECDPDPAKRST